MTGLAGDLNDGGALREKKRAEEVPEVTYAVTACNAPQRVPRIVSRSGAAR